VTKAKQDNDQQDTPQTVEYATADDLAALGRLVRKLEARLEAVEGIIAPLAPQRRK